MILYVSDELKNKIQVEKRRTAVVSSWDKLLSTWVVNMDVKLKLLKTYIKPLIYYGIETLTVKI